ncbi:hypothetical protein V6N13_136538 [Hibiscus sabdariffa]
MLFVEEGRNRLRMEKLQKSCLFIVVVLLFAAGGSEIMAQPQSQPLSQGGKERACTYKFVISYCSQNVCNRECANKFPPSGIGFCPDVRLCVCSYPCS